MVQVACPSCLTANRVPGERLGEHPAFEAASRKLYPKVRLVKVNTEQAPQLAARLNIRALPTLVLFRGGVEQKRVSGALDAASLVRWAS